MNKRMANTIKTMLAEDHLNKRIEERTKSEWRKLYCRRSFLIALNFFFVAGSCWAIIEVNIREESIKLWFSNLLTDYNYDESLSILVDFLPVIV